MKCMEFSLHRMGSRLPDPNGDRVQIVLSGKYLAYGLTDPGTSRFPQKPGQQTRNRQLQKSYRHIESI